MSCELEFLESISYMPALSLHPLTMHFNLFLDEEKERCVDVPIATSFNGLIYVVFSFFFFLSLALQLILSLNNLIELLLLCVNWISVFGVDN